MRLSFFSLLLLRRKSLRVSLVLRLTLYLKDRKRCLSYVDCIEAYYILINYSINIYNLSLPARLIAWLKGRSVAVFAKNAF